MPLAHRRTFASVQKMGKGVVAVSVTLRRGTPGKAINFQPTATHFHLDTLKVCLARICSLHHSPARVQDTKKFELS